MRIEQLEYILTVAQYGSLSRASANIFISQPTLSASIASLEKELGKSLFRRTRRGMELTPVGESLLPLIEKTVEDFYAIKKKAGLKETDKNMHVQLIAANQTMPIFQAAIQRTREIFSGVRFYLHQSNPSSLLRDYVDNSYSLALSFAYDEELARHRDYAQSKNLRFMPLYNDTLCLFSRSNSRFHNLACMDFNNLNEDTPIAMPLSFLHTSHLGGQSMWTGLSALTAFDDRESLKREVDSRDILGCTTLLQARLDPDFENGRYRTIRLEQCRINLVHYLSYHKEKEVSDVEADLIQQIETQYQFLAL